jgi:hypothetical protein
MMPANKKEFFGVLVPASLMMSRQDGYRSGHLMSNVDTDLDPLEQSRTPSPPLRLADTPKHEDNDQNGGVSQPDDAPPQTPYYDYACNNPIRESIDVSQMKNRNNSLN